MMVQTNNLIMRFEYADGRMPVAMTRGGATYYLTHDQVGSLKAVADGAGNVVKRIDYDSFGNIIDDTNPSFDMPFGFAGGLHDKDTGLIRFGYRDYDPDIGRWTAKDPILFAGGDTDLFGYVLNNPVNMIDPYGLYSLYELEHDLANYSAGLGDALLLGFGDNLRDLTGDALGLSDVVDPCSASYKAGGWTSFAFGVSRLGYAALAKGGSILASSGAAASVFRSSLKNIFRLGFGKGFRSPNLSKYTSDAALRVASGRTNPFVNIYGAGVTTTGAIGGRK